MVNIDEHDLWITDNLNEGHLDWYFFMIGGLCLCAFMAFLCGASKYQYNDFEKDMLVVDTNRSDPDEMFADVLMTTPKNTKGDQKEFDYEIYNTPPGIKDEARTSVIQF